MKKKIHGILGIALSVLMALSLIAGPASMPASADEYTYTATFYAGNHGRFTSRTGISVNNGKGSYSHVVERAKDGSRITISGLSYGDVVRFDAAISGAVEMDADSLYYVKGVRDSGSDNAEAGQAAFVVTRDRDFVVAYGMKSAEQVSYTVYYQTMDGQTLAPAQTYYGNIGDKPVAAYQYIEGYTPMSYNLTKTLSADPSQNDMVFRYKQAEGEEIRVTVDGGTEYIYIQGPDYTVRVPGPTIVQQQPSTGGDTGNNGGGNNNNPYGDGTNGGQGGTGDNGQNQGSQGTGDGAQNPGDGQGQGGTGDNGQNNGQNNGGQGTGDGAQNPGDGQNNGGTGDNGQNNGGQGTGNGNNGQGGTDINPGTNLQGTGSHGARPGEQQEDPNVVDDGNGGTVYRPGGSLDVVISTDYTPQDVIDLDDNPSGVPLTDNPLGNQGDIGDMNENQNNGGTGELEPEKKGVPVVPIAIAGVAVLGLAAGGIFLAYKKQQNAGGDDGGDE